jgi:MFS family permease
MCVLIAVNQLGFGAVVPVIALYARSFGVTQSAIRLAIAIYGLARFLVALPAGQLGDRLGRRTASPRAGSSPRRAISSARTRQLGPSSARASWRARAPPWWSHPARSSSPTSRRRHGAAA